MLLWVAVLACLYGFLLTMARLEPITGDGWYNACDIKESGHEVSDLVDRLRYLHHRGNPRIGQLFTMLTYIPGPLHVIMTPLVILSLFLLVFVHALGRWPRLSSWTDAGLVLVGAAFCWLAVPQPGHAFFYRPITTNYLYTLTLLLAVFVPFRLARPGEFRLLWLAPLLIALPVSTFVGKTNEHTGPTAIVFAAIFCGVALRRKDYRNLPWMASSLLGLVVGYLYLFFAPGQRVRYGKLGEQSVLQTITDRGLMDSAKLAGNFCEYVGPLLLALLVVAVVFALERTRDGRPLELSAPSVSTVAAYVLIAAMIVGTAFAAPKNHYRLFIAPAVFLSIAGVAAVAALLAEPWTRRVIFTTALGTHLVFMWIFLDLYGEIAEDEEARLALVAAARPGHALRVPRMRHYKRTPYFYGDSIGADPRHRERMARLYDLEEVWLEGKKRKPTSPKKRKR